MGVRSLVVPVTEPVAILAGGFRSEGFRDGTADCIIPATARSGGHRVVTGDAHFKGLDDAIFIG